MFWYLHSYSWNENYEYFWGLSIKIVANIDKMVVEIIRRNVTSNMRVFIFWVISAECMNIIEIDILLILDNTRYFIP